MKPSAELNWVQGLGVAYATLGAVRRDRYSWLAKAGECWVFSAEIDHEDRESTRYDHESGTFRKSVPAMSRRLGHAALSVSHSTELFEAVSSAYREKLPCRVLLVRGTKFGTSKGPIRAAADADFWMIARVRGSVDEGYGFVAVRTAIESRDKVPGATDTT